MEENKNIEKLNDFVVIGVDCAIEAGFANNALVLIFSGCISGVGGGMLRDICSATMGTHEGTEDSHICEYCGEVASDCKDDNHDHNCDICGETLSECGDENPMDHKCDVCDKTLSSFKNEDGDNKCDICGQEIIEHEWGTLPY